MAITRTIADVAEEVATIGRALDVMADRVRNDDIPGTAALVSALDSYARTLRNQARQLAGRDYR